MARYQTNGVGNVETSSRGNTTGNPGRLHVLRAIDILREVNSIPEERQLKLGTSNKLTFCKDHRLHLPLPGDGEWKEHPSLDADECT
jgi:hypothetical protein